MINLYINYPHKKFTVHSDQSCTSIRSHHKDDQRVIHLNHKSASKELLRFLENQHRFASEQDFNDMWVVIDFDDPIFERHVVDHIWKLAARNYSPFRGIKPEDHCESTH